MRGVREGVSGSICALLGLAGGAWDVEMNQGVAIGRKGNWRWQNQKREYCCAGFEGRQLRKSLPSMSTGAAWA